MLLVILSLNLYPLLLAGWASNRKFALIGAMRGIAQTISYEIRFALFILAGLVLRERVRLYDWRGIRKVSSSLLRPVFFILWLVSCVAETNRTPFDFAEGESELVSGFNIEFGAGGFALLFIAEYGRILFLRGLTWSLFLGHDLRQAQGILGALALVF